MSGTYSFLNVTASLTGPGGEIDLGYGAAIAEEGITIAMAGDANTMTIGADGEGMHSLHADKSGTITVRLLKTSPTRAKLQTLYNAQRLVPATWGQNLIVVRDTRSGDVTTARQCAFKKRADLTYAKDGGMEEWVFDAVKIDTIRGTY